MITLLNDVTITTAIAITSDGSNLDVTDGF
jgi:hypothetical protein